MFISRQLRLLRTFAVYLLRFKNLRYLFVKNRYLFLKKNLRTLEKSSDQIGEPTIKHNLSAFDDTNLQAAFGCGERMGLLVYPVVAFNSFWKVDRSQSKVLVVGCRTEDDIYWLKSYGFFQTIGLDLISYSKHVVLGDIHKTDFADGTFDVVLLAYMLAYSKDPAAIVKESRRILKPGGLLGIGIAYNPELDRNHLNHKQMNTINSTAEMIELLNSTIDHKLLFEYDHENLKKAGDANSAVISICN